MVTDESEGVVDRVKKMMAEGRGQRILVIIMALQQELDTSEPGSHLLVVQEKLKKYFQYFEVYFDILQFWSRYVNSPVFAPETQVSPGQDLVHRGRKESEGCFHFQ